MSWVKIDDRLPGNTKVVGLSDRAFRVYVASICYSSAHLSDGEIPCAALPDIRGTAKIAEELVSAGLWDTTSRKGWTVHDYLVYNRSKVKALETSEARGKAGSKGAAKRWQNESQNDGNVFLSASSSRDLSPNPDPVSLKTLEEQEGQNDGKLPDTVYRQIDTAWIQATGTTLPRVAGERFEAYAQKAPPQWVLDAIEETGHGNKKDPRYTYAILDNWIRDGREQAPAANGTNPFKAGAERIAAARERMA